MGCGSQGVCVQILERRLVQCLEFLVLLKIAARESLQYDEAMKNSFDVRWRELFAFR